MSEQAETFRERKRRMVQADLVAVAKELFVSQGYEATTVEQIAAGVGMSERTFFRYFPSKEALVLGRYEDLAASLSAALAARPADEPVWVSLRRAFDDLVAESDAEAEAGRTRGMRAVVESTDALRAGYLARMERVRESVAEVLAGRLAEPAPASGSTPASADAAPLAPSTAPAVVGAAFSCLSVAYSVVTRDGGSLAAALDAAMGAVASAASAGITDPARTLPDA
ncbi:TetR family transcriptional regulator [Demequina sp. NBRC 110057]|uniref:TetR family transcriptional regulator n=1 Tax=Demequina sp. NBRC 110057 TaxID=1570346 RepID=UPI0009FDBBE4|nr:TetR family transcriptional regulator [Demequina sp. NBRC 110057]